MKKALLIFCTFAVACVGMELLSCAVYYGMYGTPFSYKALQERRQHVRREMGRTDAINEKRAKEAGNHYIPGIGGGMYAAHPFLGYVRNPETAPTALLQANGFLAEQDLLAASADANNVIIGISGGSVSELLFLHERSILHEYLSSLPQFKDKRIIIGMFGMYAYHQPQQVLAVTYYLAQGGRLDMLINLDGKNESEASYRNARQGIFPLYPIYWSDFFAGGFNPDTIALLGDIAMWKNIRLYADNFFAHADFSITMSTIWALLDSYCEKQLGYYRMQAQQAPKANALPYFLSGPRNMTNAPDAALAEYSLRSWVQGSRQLAKLAKDYDFSYMHFLQPSQYVPDSKPLSQEELKQVYNLESRHARTVRAAYPKFLATIPQLREEGIAAVDLTRIYAAVPDTIYIDESSHVNQRGNDIMAHAIGKAIIDQMVQKH